MQSECTGDVIEMTGGGVGIDGIYELRRELGLLTCKFRANRHA